MARLLVRREMRGLEEGVPPTAVLGSLGVHTLALLILLWGATRLELPRPPQVFQVELVAAPREAPVRTVPAPDRPRPARVSKPKARPVETKPAPKKRRRDAARPRETKERGETEPRPEPAVEERPAAPPEPARKAVEGSPVRLEGAPFPYPDYLANIIVQIKRHWRPPSGRARLRAELAFTIRRDGSVEDIVWVRRSGDPAFDLEARGAIEAAGRRGAFGPLPPDYPSDRLRVSFFFDPSQY